MHTNENGKHEAVIGLEVHVQLLTKTKIFCSCKNEFGHLPNTLSCPVCLGLPGSLPVFNKEVLKLVIKIALALNCEISNLMKFDRKNYFYPDLPKNYQISQYDLPVAKNGFLEIASEGKAKNIRIRRVHLEEDAGKLVHDDNRTGDSFVDFNRTGTPLAEIVSEPDIFSPEQAYDFLKGLKNTLLYIDVSDCNMEEGSLRCDANVSVRKIGEKKLGTKVEVKNMNSFKAVKSALEYEIKRQIDILNAGNAIAQETRLWDADKQKTFGMRSKEETEDYRYFPEPDLVPFNISSLYINDIQKTLPELPSQKTERFITKYGLDKKTTDFIISDKYMADFFEQCVALCGDSKKVANWISGSIAMEMNSRNVDFLMLTIRPEQIADLINLVDSQTISATTAKKVFSEMLETKELPSLIVDSKKLGQVSGEAELSAIIDNVLNRNEKSITDYLAGKQQAFSFLIGQVMKETSGKANPQVVSKILMQKIKNKKAGKNE